MPTAEMAMDPKVETKYVSTVPSNICSMFSSIVGIASFNIFLS